MKPNPPSLLSRALAPALRCAAWATAATLTTTPAWAHFTSQAAGHWHASDTWGVLIVAALAGVAAWLDRRSR
jgi:H+/Cl- antiporter ClcA